MVPYLSLSPKVSKGLNLFSWLCIMNLVTWSYPLKTFWNLTLYGRDYSAIVFAADIWDQLCLCDKVWEAGPVNASSLICVLSCWRKWYFSIDFKGWWVGYWTYSAGQRPRRNSSERGGHKRGSCWLHDIFIQYNMSSLIQLCLCLWCLLPRMLALSSHTYQFKVNETVVTEPLRSLPSVCGFMFSVRMLTNSSLWVIYIRELK